MSISTGAAEAGALAELETEGGALWYMTIPPLTQTSIGPFIAAGAGYVHGRECEDRIPLAEGSYDRLPAMAVELVGRKVEVIVTGSAGAAEAKSATSTIPIVFLSGGDPVALGLVASLGRPGGNLTGVSLLTIELNPKRLELLSELVPEAKMIALLVNPNNTSAERTIQNMEEAARVKGVQLPILFADALHPR